MSTAAPYNIALTATQIPCCLCGTMIFPNAANQCSTCLAQEFDLQDRLQRGPGGADKITIHQCRLCRRFKRTEKHWEHAEHESPQLLSICLKHIPALQHQAASGSSGGGNNAPLHLVDAGWIWTEPHSMRYKLRLTVRTEIQNVKVQQRVMVLLHCAFLMCSECNREFTNRTWQSVVQLRQKRTDDAPKKGLAALEMALAKNKEVRKHVLKIDNTANGFDFYFLSIPHAQAFVAYLQRIAPMRVRTTKKLVSTDVKSNTANMKHTMTCDLVPLCKDDLVLIQKSAKKAKLAGRLVIVTKLASVIHFLDASPKRENMADSLMELSAETYYKYEKQYRLLQAGNRMARFVILDVELCNSNKNNDPTTTDHDGSDTNPRRQQQQQKGQPHYEGPESGVEKYALADVQVARESDFGVNDETLSSVTHLGHLVSPGDVVMGYDLVATVGGDWELEESFHNSFVLPDVVLVKKVAGSGGVDVAPTATVDNIKAANNSNNDAHEYEGKRRLTKKKERRLRRDGKRARELEGHALRMGFIDGEEAEGDFVVDEAGIEAELANDPELAAEVSALERDFEALAMNMSLPADVIEEEEEYVVVDEEALEHDDDEGAKDDFPTRLAITE